MWDSPITLNNSENQVILRMHQAGNNLHKRLCRMGEV